MNEEHDFNLKTLLDYALRIQALRRSMLVDINETGATAKAEQFFLLALSALEQAKCYLQIAGLEQASTSNLPILI